jgi:UDP-2,4-diacetamido-2,4,6-trideoxy-beta-L-altropyranose hydrolase
VKNTATDLAIRADANARVGVGHVMRCMALAETWHRTGGETFLFTADVPPFAAAAAQSRGVAIRSHASADDAWSALADWARANAGAWVALDSYDAGPDTHRSIRAAGARLLVIDDVAAHPDVDCDILLNPNIDAERLDYRVAASTHCCFGPRFALIRDEFRRPQAPRRFDLPASRVVVTFGGADVHDQAGRVARLLVRAAPPLHVTIVAGQADGAAGGDDDARDGIHIRFQGVTSEMAGLLASADMAICAAGSTCWELAHLGVPALAVIVADNQIKVATGLHEAGVLRSAGWFDKISDDELASAIDALRRDVGRGKMSRRGRALVDGLGADRVVEAMRLAAVDA